MRKKYRIKQNKSASEFTKLTGIETWNVYGDNQCILVKSTHITPKRLPSPKYAYYVYNLCLNTSHDVYVSTSCGVKNCVKKEHLQPKYKPTVKDQEYIKTYLKIDGIELLSKNLKVPIELFTEYILLKNRNRFI